MLISWSDEDSEDRKNDEEDLISDVAFAGYLSTNVCSHIQKKSHVATKILHYYNNTVSIDDIAISEKDCGSLTDASIESNDGLDFNYDALREPYQRTYLEWLKVSKENQYLVSHVDTLVTSKETLCYKTQVLETIILEKKFKIEISFIKIGKNPKSP